MRIVNLATAKARLSELIHSAESGEEILITRHGQPVVRLASVDQPKRSIASPAAFRSKLPGCQKIALLWFALSETRALDPPYLDEAMTTT